MRPRADIVAVEISPDTVRRGDVLSVGGRPLQVVDLTALPSGAKRLEFRTGETFTMRAATRLSANRIVRGQPQQRAYRRRPQY